MATADNITGPVNLGNPCELSIRELASIVMELTGGRSKLVDRPLPTDDPRQRQPDISMARTVLGWEPQVDLREGLAKTIRYFDELLGSRAVPG
jgi:UDP-glucuronate decarboxylase